MATDFTLHKDFPYKLHLLNYKKNHTNPHTDGYITNQALSSNKLAQYTGKLELKTLEQDDDAPPMGKKKRKLCQLYRMHCR